MLPEDEKSEILVNQYTDLELRIQYFMDWHYFKNIKYLNLGVPSCSCRIKRQKGQDNLCPVLAINQWLFSLKNGHQAVSCSSSFFEIIITYSTENCQWNVFELELVKKMWLLHLLYILESFCRTCYIKVLVLIYKLSFFGPPETLISE